MKKIVFATCLLLFHFVLSAQYKVTFVVHDLSTIQREQVYISGTFNNWDSLHNQQYLLTPVAKGIHSITLMLPAGRTEYKFSGGDWKSVEKSSLGDEPGNRSCVIHRDTTVEDEVPLWRDLMIPATKLRLYQETTDTSRVKSMTVLAVIYSNDPMVYDVDSSLHYMEAASQLLNRIHFSDATKSWPHYSRWSTTIQNQHANVLQSLGNNLKALEIQLNSLKEVEKNRDTVNWIFMLSAVADEYIRIRDYESALDYIHKGVALLDQSVLPDIHFRSFFEGLWHEQRGICYLHLHELDKSLFHTKTAITFALHQYNYFKEASLLQLLGDIFIAKHIPDSALIHYHRSINIARTHHNPKALPLSLKGMALVYREKGQIDSALYYAKLSVSYIQTQGALLRASGVAAETYLIQISPIIADLYKRKNQMDSAYHYLALTSMLKDSLYNPEKIRDLQKITFKETLRIRQEEEQLTAARQQLKNRLRLYVFFISAGALLFLVVFQYRNNKQKHATNLLLKSQKRDLENTLGALQLTQKQLIQSEKMASLGELTAGIAHEIQNPLNFVNNFAEVNAELIDELRDELAMVRPSSPTAGNLQLATDVVQTIKENESKIIFHGKRADAIVKGMLQHSRASSGVKEPTDINALADEYLRLAYHGLRAKDKSFNATITTDFDESIGLINVVPQDIGRVILNLITNAFYAVSAPKSPEGDLPPHEDVYQPTVIVSTKKWKSPLGDIEAGAGELTPSVEICVIDNGPGIPAHIIDKIFQPFFTTKPTGQGTGLGLSLSYDIVKAHGGELKVESKEARPDDPVGRGEGTKFIIHLPLYQTD